MVRLYGTHKLFNTALYNRGGRECHEPLRVVLGELSKVFYRERGLRPLVVKLYTLTVQCDRHGLPLRWPCHRAYR